MITSTGLQCNKWVKAERIVGDRASLKGSM